jgi:hypothetical protein
MTRISALKTAPERAEDEKVPNEFQTFDAVMERVLTVSREELKSGRRLGREDRPKRIGRVK